MSSSGAAVPSPRAGGRAGRERGAVLAGLVLGGALLLGSAGRTWAVVRTRPAPGLPLVVDRVSGASLAPVVTAAGLLALAGVAGLLAVRGLARQLVGLLVLVAGVLALGYAVAGARATPATDGTVESVSHGPWPWVAALGGALVAGAGVLAVLRGRRWPAMSARYERPAGEGSAGSSGPSQPGEQSSGQPSSGQPSSGQHSPGADARGKELWDALDRGEDPTERG